MTDAWRPNIIEVFEHYGARVVHSGGQWQKATCPLDSHEDRSPSASLNEEAGKWRCWVCDKAGDGLDIVKENEGLAGYVDCLAFCKAKFGGRDGDVRAEPVRRGGLSVRPRSNGSRGTFTPPWRNL